MNTVNWSELPEELVSKIADNIVAAEDFFAFRATCKSWQSAVPTNQCNPRVPTLFFVDSNDNFKCLDHNNQRISQCKASRDESRAWGSACGWIFMDNRLVNPLTNETISLPENKMSKYLEIKRVVVFKRPASWSVFGCDTEDDIKNGIVVVLIYTYKLAGTRIISRRIRTMRRHEHLQLIYIDQFNNQILTIRDRMAGDVADVVCFEDRVYGVDKNGNLMLLTCNSNNGRCTFQFSSIVKRPSIFNVLEKRIEGINLVESAGELLMIVKKGSLPYFKVYKFSFKKKKWLTIDSLGSSAVFIGTNYTMSVFAPEDDEDSYIRGDCIYFSRHFYSSTCQEKGCSYLCFYDMKSKMISQHCRDGKKIECSGCCWLLPSLS